MAAPIDLRNDFDSVSLPPREEDQGRDTRAVVCWRWPRSTMVIERCVAHRDVVSDHSRLGLRFNAR